MNNILVSLAAAIAAGLVLTRVVRLFHLPDVTGYLIAGLIVGPFCLGMVSSDQLASIGIVITIALGFIAFSIGAEFKLPNLRALGSSAVIITLLQAFGAVILVDLVLIAAGFDLPLALTLGAIATATAPAATMMVVRQYKAKGPVSGILLPVVAMDDAVGLMVFAISLAVSKVLAAGGEMSAYTMLLLPMLEIVLSLIIGFTIGAAATFLMRFFHSRNNFLSIAIAAVLLGVGLSEAYGLSSLLLCMSIGAAVCNLKPDSEAMMEQCDRWTAPLFILFFVISGADLDLSAIPAVGLLGVLYIVARSLGKYLGAYAGASIVKAEPNIRKYLGITLLPQAGVALGMAQMTGTALPAYGAEISTVVICATIVYEFIGPVLTKIALTKAGEIEKSPAAVLKAEKAARQGR